MYRQSSTTRLRHTTAAVRGIRAIDLWSGCRELAPSWGYGVPSVGGSAAERRRIRK
jgi:hypothetical protein